MKKFLSTVTAVLLPILILSFAIEAATVKRPLTVKTYGDQKYLEWTGSAPVVTADALIFYADTAAANLYQVDPGNLLFTDKAASAGFNPWLHYPGQIAQDSLCVALTVTGDADAATSDVYLSQSATKTGTVRKTGPPTAKTHTSTATTTDLQIVRLAYVPSLFWTLTVDPTTSTDSIEVLAARIYPCGQ
jgi:hypothetical protein